MRRWLQPIRLPILYYHEIGRSREKHVVHPDDFSAQLDWLQGAGFVALSLDDALEIYGGHRAAPTRAVILSFDDGRAGVRDFAAPALARRRMPAMLYLVSGWLDGGPIPDVERYSTFVGWSDLEALEQAGFAFGSHSVSHRNLKRLPLPEALREVVDSRRRLEERLTRPVHHFSFPYGRRTRALAKLVRAAGYRSAVVTGERINGRFARLHRLYRLRVDGRADLATFQQRLLS